MTGGRPGFRTIGRACSLPPRAAWVLLPLLLAACAAPPGGSAPGTGSEAGAGIASAPSLPKLPAANLLGLSSDRVAQLLGSPSFTRSETPAQIWQYTSPDCVLMLFFYGTGPGTTKHLLHIDSRRRRDLSPAPEQRCLDHVRAHQIATQALLTSTSAEP